ncbi:MAG: protein translocase subunit SecD [Dehalococcoidia bacterium]
MRRRNTQVLLAIFILAALGGWFLAVPRTDLPWPGGRFVREGMRLGLDLRGGTHMVMQADLSQIGPDEDADDAMQGAVEIIRRRVDAFGVTEPVVQRQPGGNRIVVQLPGIRDVDEAVRLIGQTAQLDFREMKEDEGGNPVLDEQGQLVWIPSTGVGSGGQEVHLTGRFLKRQTRVTLRPETNEPTVEFEWEEEGGILFEQITTRLVGKDLGIFLDDELVSSPVVRSTIKERGIIDGLTLDDARRLAIQLNAGALPVPLEIIQRQDVDAILGADSLGKSLVAGQIGLALVLLFMLAYYRMLGLVAVVALVVYGIMVMSLFKIWPVTLTLTGIAAFILSLGMAVDANVLIFERMKEELRGGRTLGAAIERGFNRAWPAIRDSNVTTFIICAILYWFGSTFGASSIMGFALTLFIGVAISMFSAIVVTRSLLRFMVRLPLGRRPGLFRV